MPTKLGIDLEMGLDIILKAGNVMREHKGSKTFTCGIINAKSGACSENCAFCAQSKHHNVAIEIYPLMDTDKILERAIVFAKAGVNKFGIVTSGFKMTAKNMGSICKSIEKIKSETNLSVCASLGTLTKDMAISLKQCGVSRYHHNLETARSFFDQICTTHSYDDDVETIKIAQATGLEVCCGGIMGMGESWAQRIEFASFLNKLKVDSVPINFLNPIQGTPLGGRNIMSPIEALRCIALFRLINPRKDIVVCGGRDITLKDFQSWVFIAGANGLMVGNYLTTKGRNIKTDIEMVKDMGFES
ncbi:MAG: biotin synthase BioB [Deltaproteobacteria bacterium]